MNADSAHDYAYPTSLLESAAAQAVLCPVKRQKTYSHKSQSKKRQSVPAGTAAEPGQPGHSKSNPLPATLIEAATEVTDSNVVPSDSASKDAEWVDENQSRGDEGFDTNTDNGIHPDHDDHASSAVDNVTSQVHNYSALELFIDSVAAGVAGFKHVHSNFCVVQGWDYRRNQSTVGV